MDDKERIRSLEDEIEHLKREKMVVLDAMEMTSNISNFQTSLNQLDDPRLILQLTAERLQRLVACKSLAFYLVSEDDSDFFPAFVEPETEKEIYQREMDALIDDKTFAWTMQRNKPVIITSIDNEEKLILHGMRTSSRARGMFIGTLAHPEEEILDLSLFLFSVTIMACSNGLESFELYRQLKRKNKALEEHIHELKENEQKRRRLEQQLHQAQKLESIGTLAGGIAHDFNNILGVILGYGELSLMELPEDPENPVRSHMENQLSAVKRARQVVRQLLAFSRKGDEERKAFNSNVLVKETLHLLRATLPRTISIRHHVVGEENILVADPTQVQQVIMNLCTNALHAMEGDEGILNVTIHPDTLDETFVKKTDLVFQGMLPGDYICITVSDNGRGIESTVLERIFDPYFTTKQPGQGTGLGLSVVHGIVRKYAGNMTVESQLDQGTTFKIWFPAHHDAQIIMEKEPPLPKGKGEKILLVEDEEELRVTRHKLLEHLNYKVISCNRSTAALEIFLQSPADFDLLITDMTMPEMTGIQLLRRIREIRSEMPVLLCTGFSEYVDAQSARALGINEYLMKPIDKNALSVAIRKILDKKK